MHENFGLHYPIDDILDMYARDLIDKFKINQKITSEVILNTLKALSDFGSGSITITLPNGIDSDELFMDYVNYTYDIKYTSATMVGGDKLYLNDLNNVVRESWQRSI
jgi:hypothetical protein